MAQKARKESNVGKPRAVFPNFCNSSEKEKIHRIRKGFFESNVLENASRTATASTSTHASRDSGSLSRCASHPWAPPPCNPPSCTFGCSFCPSGRPCSRSCCSPAAGPRCMGRGARGGSPEGGPRGMARALTVPAHVAAAERPVPVVGPGLEASPASPPETLAGRSLEAPGRSHVPCNRRARNPGPSP